MVVCITYDPFYGIMVGGGAGRRYSSLISSSIPAKTTQLPTGPRKYSDEICRFLFNFEQTAFSGPLVMWDMTKAKTSALSYLFPSVAFYVPSFPFFWNTVSPSFLLWHVIHSLMVLREETCQLVSHVETCVSWSDMLTLESTVQPCWDLCHLFIHIETFVSGLVMLRLTSVGQLGWILRHLPHWDLYLLTTMLRLTSAGQLCWDLCQLISHIETYVSWPVMLRRASAGQPCWALCQLIGRVEIHVSWSEILRLMSAGHLCWDSCQLVSHVEMCMRFAGP